VLRGASSIFAGDNSSGRRPKPINAAAASIVIRLSAGSIMTRSRVGSCPLIWLTVIARQPERLDDNLPQSHFYR
jgi:hypothetical protein